MPLNLYTGTSLTIDMLLSGLTEKQLEAFKMIEDGKLLDDAINEYNNNYIAANSSSSASTASASATTASNPNPNAASSLPIDRSLPEYEHPDKFTLLRFLQADDYDVKKAINRMVNTLAFRQANNVNKILDNPPTAAIEIYRRYRVRSLGGFDKNGFPIVYERLGAAIGTENHLCLPWEDFLACMLYDVEKMTLALRETSEKNKKPIHRVTLVSDLSGMVMTQAFKNLSFLKRMLTIIPSHYPEFAGKLFVINVPWYVGKGWAIVSTFLEKKTADAVCIRQGVPMKELLELMDISQIPKEFGGESDLDFPKPELFKPS